MEIPKCVFCGTVGQVRGVKVFYVQCTHCHATGPEKDTKEEAVKMWDWLARNIRAVWQIQEIVQTIL